MRPLWGRCFTNTGRTVTLLAGRKDGHYIETHYDEVKLSGGHHKVIMRRVRSPSSVFQYGSY